MLQATQVTPNRNVSNQPPNKIVREKDGNPLGNQRAPKMEKDRLTIPKNVGNRSESQKWWMTQGRTYRGEEESKSPNSTSLSCAGILKMGKAT